MRERGVWGFDRQHDLLSSSQHAPLLLSYVHAHATSIPAQRATLAHSAIVAEEDLGTFLGAALPVSNSLAAFERVSRASWPLELRAPRAEDEVALWRKGDFLPSASALSLPRTAKTTSKASSTTSSSTSRTAPPSPSPPGSLAPPQNLAPYTSRSEFYRIANAISKKNAKGRTPESLVTRQMRVFKEQWAGMGIFYLGLVRSDIELATAVWRNLLGARGARGIAYPDPDGASADPLAHFRRAVNIAGGSVEKLSRLEKNRGALEAEERRDDGSGVHDFPPAEADKYVAYPETMATIVEYVRRELVRLERVPDELIIGKGIIGTEGHDLEALRFGPVKDADGLTVALRQAQ
ncbi:hypothetical protein ONZ51_g1638 [Trametes cubensis]|uniref:Uncharacterized protein n=1 Tax=Trametes cubensis TaxID=1111947 RepID=A0AAD7U286_9APHY|nr:hypothetical protein ONZ51_g1638 [Trametes cubensis]